MNTPGFTAEASLYKTAVEYHSCIARQGRRTGVMGDNKGRVVPQMPLTCSSLCRCCGNGNKSCCDVWIIYC
jgi:hypothetical protein